jgi:hypothetical protein
MFARAAASVLASAFQASMIAFVLPMFGQSDVGKWAGREWQLAIFVFVLSFILWYPMTFIFDRMGSPYVWVGGKKIHLRWRRKL